MSDELVGQWHEMIHIVVEKLPLVLLYDNHNADGTVPDGDECLWDDLSFHDEMGDPDPLPCETEPASLLFLPSPGGILRITLCDQHAAMMLLKRSSNTTDFGE